MNAELIDRQREVDELREMAAAEGRQLALLYGRRRVGKTFLLTHAWDQEEVEVLYFTASATSPEVNRRTLLREVSRWSQSELRPEDLPTWRTVFRRLFELKPRKPLVVIFDEFQYLGTEQKGMRNVASELNAIWESNLNREAGLLVVLSGSAIRSMEALESGGSPLFGRLDWRRKLEPFDYFDAAQMVPFDHRDSVMTYAAFGGMPKYLAAVDGKRGWEQNVVDLLMSSDGEVRIQVETALQQEEGLRHPHKYRSILASVGLSRKNAGEIAAPLGRNSDSALKRMINRLVELEYLEGKRNFDAPANHPVRYRIADPAQRCYYGLVLPNESAIAASGADRVWSTRIKPQMWPQYVGAEVFEDIVRQAYMRWIDQQQVPAVDEWGRWEGRDRNRRSLEIDVVTRLLDGRMMTGAIKFRTRRTGAKVFIEHLEALRRLADSGYGWAHEAIEPDSVLLFVSSAGFKDSFWEVCEEYSDYRIITRTLSDLYG